MLRRLLIAGMGVMLAAPTAVCAAGRYYPTDERVVYYLACFLYTSSEYGAVAFPPVKTNGMEDFHNFRRNIEERVRPPLSAVSRIRVRRGQYGRGRDTVAERRLSSYVR